MFTAFLDACVLLPVSLCDTLLRAAEEDFFRPTWSQAALREVERAFIRVHPDIGAARIRTRLAAANRAFPGACVAGYEPLITGVLLPDPDDRHVVAAAVAAHADAIITANLPDFPDDVLNPLGLHAIHPDDFLLNLLDLFPSVVGDIITEQAAATRAPSLTTDDVLASLHRAGVPQFVEAVQASRWTG